MKVTSKILTFGAQRDGTIVRKDNVNVSKLKGSIVTKDFNPSDPIGRVEDAFLKEDGVYVTVELEDHNDKVSELAAGFYNDVSLGLIDMRCVSEIGKGVSYYK